MTRLIQRLAIPALLMVWATVYLLEVLGQPPKSQVLIRPVYFIMLVLFFVNSWTDYKKWKSEMAAEKEHEKSADGKEETRDLLRLGVFILGTALYLVAMPLIGFAPATAIYLFFGFTYLKAKNVYVTIAISLVLTFLLYYVFKVALRVPLPAGPLGI